MEFTSLSIGSNLGIFAAASVVVWVAGNKLADYAESIAKRTGLSKAFLGLLLLGVATSLPEIATTVTASIGGNARLATNNLFGGVAMQIAILAIVDLLVGRGPLTYFTPQPVLLLQGVMLALLLALAIAGIAAGEPVSLAGVGLFPVLLFGGYLFTLYMSHHEEFFPRWQVVNPLKASDLEVGRQEGGMPPAEPARESGSTWRLTLSVGLAGAAILIAGWALASVGEALAEQTGLGANFVGFALVAISTSLPELSTCIAAVRNGSYAMAVANILGTNCLEVALFFLADLFFRPGPILATADRFAIFAAALGILVTCIYLLGLLERRDKTFLRMGLDSIAVLIVYLAGTALLYSFR